MRKELGAYITEGEITMHLAADISAGDIVRYLGVRKPIVVNRWEMHHQLEAERRGECKDKSI